MNSPLEKILELPKKKSYLDDDGESSGGKSRFSTRVILAIVSFFLPGLGQAIQSRYLRTLDFLILYGTAILAARFFFIQLHIGVFLPFLLFGVQLVPAIWAATDAIKNRATVGDADTIVRNIFIYCFLFLLTIMPFYLINNTFGFKVYRLGQGEKYLEPILLAGDAIIIDRTAYGPQTLARDGYYDSVKVGDIVFHAPVPEESGGDNSPFHWVLAVPGDIIEASAGEARVNGKQVVLPFGTDYMGPRNFGPIVVPQNQVFLVDARWRFSPFYIEKIRGKASGILWSKRPDGRFRFERFGKRIKSPIIESK